MHCIKKRTVPRPSAIWKTVYERQKQNMTPPGCVAVCNELGGVCRAMGQTDRAKELYHTVLTNLERVGLTHSEHYATALINTGDVYVNSRELEEALRYFLKARDLLVERGSCGRLPDGGVVQQHKYGLSRYRRNGEGRTGVGYCIPHNKKHSKMLGRTGNYVYQSGRIAGPAE